jgi:hypothetical protein
VQNIAVTVFSCLRKQNGKNLPYFDKATKLALTAKLSSIGSSGGMTLVMMSTQSNNSLLFFKSLSIPVGALQHQERKETVPARTLTQTYQLAAIAKINKHPIKRKLSILFVDTLSVLNIMVRTSCPCAVPNPVRSTTPRHPPSGVLIGAFSPALAALPVPAWRTLVLLKRMAPLC